MSRTSALKVLDHAMSGCEGADNCQKFIDILGLRSIAPLFMKTPQAHKKAGPNRQELEEHIVSILASLLKNCQGPQRQRLLSKFVENDHEKVDRLMELHFKYLEKVRTVDDHIEHQKREAHAGRTDIGDDNEEEYYMKRLDAGLLTLQLIDYIMLETCHSCTSGVRKRVDQILNLRGGSIKAIKSIMREYAGNIGDAKDLESQSAEQERILQLVDRF
jgi:beta-catenin-like protein 1